MTPSARLRGRLSRLRGLPLLRGIARPRRGGTARGRARPHLERGAPTRRPGARSSWRGTRSGPYTLDYVERILDDWVELHGDRGRADDGAIVAGIGKLDGRTVALDRPAEGPRREGAPPAPVRHAVSRGLREGDARDGARGRFGFPVVTLVDTPGAYPGVAAEQHGQGGAIARSQATMLAARRADGRLHHRRGHVGRRRRDRRRRPRADAGERDLLGDLARGLRADPVARRRRGEEGGRRAQAGRAALPRARRDRRDRPGARGRRPERPRRGRGAAQGGARRARSRSSRTSPPTSCGACGARSSAPWASSPEPGFRPLLHTVHRVFNGAKPL